MPAFDDDEAPLQRGAPEATPTARPAPPDDSVRPMPPGVPRAMPPARPLSQDDGGRPMPSEIARWAPPAREASWEDEGPPLPPDIARFAYPANPDGGGSLPPAAPREGPPVAAAAVPSGERQPVPVASRMADAPAMDHSDGPSYRDGDDVPRQWGDPAALRAATEVAPASVQPDAPEAQRPAARAKREGGGAAVADPLKAPASAKPAAAPASPFKKLKALAPLYVQTAFWGLVTGLAGFILVATLPNGDKAASKEDPAAAGATVEVTADAAAATAEPAAEATPEPAVE
jgi:hypothetical protein